MYLSCVLLEDFDVASSFSLFDWEFPPSTRPLGGQERWLIQETVSVSRGSGTHGPADTHSQLLVLQPWGRPQVRVASAGWSEQAPEPLGRS